MNRKILFRNTLLALAAAAAGLIHGCSTFVWATFHDRANSYFLIALAAAFAAATLIAAAIIQKRIFPARQYFPYLIWLALAALTVPLFNRSNDNFRFLDAAAAKLHPSPENPGSPTRVMLELNNETRTCLPLALNEDFTLPVTVPERGRMAVGFGAVKTTSPRDPLRIKIALWGVTPLPIDLEPIAMTRERSEWIDRTVDLAEWAGKTVNLNIRAESPNDNPAHGTTVEKQVCLSGPRVISPPAEKKNVVLIVIDTTRFDAVSTDPENPGLTPAIASLAARGTAFQRNYAQSSWTVPSMGSMLTSRMPIQTGALSTNRLKVDPRLPTIAELAQRRGLRTAAFSANELVRPDNGFSKGFETFTIVRSPLQYCLDIGERTTRRARQWIQQRGDDPFFMMIVYIDPHDPYLPPRDYIGQAPAPPVSSLDLLRALTNWGPVSIINTWPNDRNLETFRRLYQAEIHYLDHCIGGLIQTLESQGILGHTLIVITADHGEELKDHGLYSHGTSLYDEVIHVPLIIVDGAGPRERRTVTSITRNLDILPTILDYLAIETPAETLGVSLLPLCRGVQTGPAPPAFAELPQIENYNPSMKPHRLGLKTFYHRAIIADNFKLIQQTDLKTQAEKYEFFDLEADPHEQHPLPYLNSNTADRMRRQLDDFFSQLPGKMDMDQVAAHDPEMVKLLKSLGYIQ